MAVPGILFAIGYFFFRDQVGLYSADLVRRQATAAIQGEFDFAGMQVDLAGRAVFTDVAIRDQAGETVATAPRAVIRLNPLSVLGPNRGRRSVDVTLHDPSFTVIRREDGSFNIADLVKPSDPDAPPGTWGYTVRIVNGTADFTDRALLTNGYPHWPNLQGFAHKLLVETLGYNPDNPPALPAFHDVLGVNGVVHYNVERQELALAARLNREQGRMTVKGQVLEGGRAFNFDFGLHETELASLEPYIRHLFPELNIAPSGPPQEDDRPRLAGRIRTGLFQLSKPEGQPVRLLLDSQLSSAYLSGGDLPPLRFNRLRVNYDAPARTLSTDFELLAAGSRIVAAPTLDFDEGTISGAAIINTEDVGALRNALGLDGPALSGSLHADVRYSGALPVPNISGRIEGSSLSVAGQPLGELLVVGDLTDGDLVVEQARLGGVLPLNAKGRYSLDTGAGNADLRAGPLNAGAALRLAAALGITLPEAVQDASGTLSANANLRFDDGAVSGNASVNSQQIEIGGQSLSNLGVELALTRSALTIRNAQAALSTRLVDAFGVRSVGPLRVALRASGTAQLPPGRTDLDLKLTASTLNLEPEQAALEIDLNGPLSAPRFDAVLASTAQDDPLRLTAQGTWGAEAPLVAQVQWREMSVGFEGRADLAAQTVDGALSATNVDLGQILPGRGIDGTITVQAQISGPLAAPTVDGNVSVPRFAFAAGARELAITDAAAQFRLVQGESLSVSEGGLTFAGSRFDISGQISAAGGNELVIASEDFDLAPVLALVRAPAAEVGIEPEELPEVEASGPLQLIVSGTLADPRARIDFRSGPGTAEGQPFDNAVLQASASTAGLELEHLGIEGPLGSFSVSGAVDLARAPGVPDRGFSGLRLGSYAFDVDIDNLRARMITPLIGIEALDPLTGTLYGELAVTGDRDGVGVDGELTLAAGQFNFVPIDEAYARFTTVDGEVLIEEAYLESGTARLVGSGVIGPGAGQVDIDAGARRIDLALLAPFLGDTFGEFGGDVSLAISVSPAPPEGGYPEVDIHIANVDEAVILGGIRFTETRLEASLREGLLVIETARLVTHGTALEMGGTLAPGMVAGATQPGAGRRTNMPLNFWLETTDFRLGVLRPLLPEGIRDMLPVGTLTADLSLTGRFSDPQLSGTVAFNITELPAAVPVQLDSIGGTITFDRNRFSIGELAIGGAAGDAVSGIQITGGGLLSLRPPQLLDGAINVVLAPEGQYARVALEDFYKGTLGGQITIQPPLRTNGLRPGQAGAGLFSIGGQLVVNPGGGTSTLFLNLPDSSGGSGPPSFMFDDLRVQVLPGTEAAFAGYGIELLAELTGNLTLTGALGVSGRNALAIDGRLDIPRGGVHVLRHNLRLTGDENYIAFNGVPGEYFPLFTGQGAITLPGALTGAETFNLDPTQQVSGRDLTVFITFNRFRMGPGAGLGGMLITSDPPLPESEIRAYLLGGIPDVVFGRTDFSQFAQSELLGFGGSFISRQIAREFDLDLFALGGAGSEDNPFFINVEKEIADDLYLGYFRNFYSETNQREEWTLRYRFYSSNIGRHAQNASAQLSFRERGFLSDEVELMLRYNIRFGAGRRPDEQETGQADPAITTDPTMPAGVVTAETEAAEGESVLPDEVLERNPDAPAAVPPTDEPDPDEESATIIIGDPEFVEEVRDEDADGEDDDNDAVEVE